MAKGLAITFTKFHGLGNDFIVVSASGLPAIRRRSPHTPILASLARSICRRQTGVGADGLLVMLPPAENKNHARMRVFNADGSEAEMSGNGIRCAAAYLLGTIRSGRELRIETAAGTRQLETVKSEAGTWTFRVALGAPVLEPALIPFRAADVSSPVVGFPLPTSRGALRVTVTSMGNPHCSTFVPDFNNLDCPAVGREVENSSLFPNRTNVEFVRVVSRKVIEVRFWERGVGRTESSGTGSCAAVVASILNGLTDRRVKVRTLAGSLDVAWPKGGEVMLTGPVQLIARGTYHYSDAVTGRMKAGLDARRMRPLKR